MRGKKERLVKRMKVEQEQINMSNIGNYLSMRGKRERLVKSMKVEQEQINMRNIGTYLTRHT